MYKRRVNEEKTEINETKEEKRIREAASIGKKKWVRYKEVPFSTRWEFTLLWILPRKRKQFITLRGSFL